MYDESSDATTSSAVPLIASDPNASERYSPEGRAQLTKDNSLGLLDSLAEPAHGVVHQSSVELFGGVEEIHQEGCTDGPTIAWSAVSFHCILGLMCEEMKERNSSRAKSIEADTFPGVHHGELAGHSQDGTLGGGVYLSAISLPSVLSIQRHSERSERGV